MAINSYKSYGKNETKMRIIDALKANSPLRTRDLCNTANRDRKVVWKNLNKLREKGLVEKILIEKRGPIEKVFWKTNNLNNINPNIQQ
jgi:predicted transcriptional regulator